MCVCACVRACVCVHVCVCVQCVCMCVCVCEREREKERDREGEREREKERKTAGLVCFLFVCLFFSFFFLSCFVFCPGNGMLNVHKSIAHDARICRLVQRTILRQSCNTIICIKYSATVTPHKYYWCLVDSQFPMVFN